MGQCPPDRARSHGRRSRGTWGTSPPEFGVGDANANCPLRFLSYRYKKERSVAFKIGQNPFSAGALPRTLLGELTTLPRPPSRLERGHPSPHPTAFTLTHLGRSPWVPLRIPARSMPMPAAHSCHCFSLKKTW